MIAIVMLSDLNPPSIESLSKTIQARLPDVPIHFDASGEGPLMFFDRDVMCGIMRLDAPCPMSSQDFALAWHWPKAWEELKGHKSHMVVTVTGGPDARASAQIFCQLAAAVVEASPSSLAVHCSESDALWPAKVVPKMVTPGSDILAIPLVVSVRLVRDVAEGIDPSAIKLSAITQGLAAFGLMEIEVLGVALVPTELISKIFDLASYLISAGPVIKDGDTIGPDENTKLFVRHEASHLRPGQKVYRVEVA